MKPSLRFSFLVIARIKQSLHLLKEDFRQWLPQQAPALVPIPIPDAIAQATDTGWIARR